jgi:predicted glycogen debranching enzyme
MKRIERIIDLKNDITDEQSLISREWLISNGLGGYASGTISGAVSRRYHGMLISSLPSPLGRMVMFNHLAEKIMLPDNKLILLGSEETSENMLKIPGAGFLTEFKLEMGLPVWTYQLNDIVLEKRILMPYMQNSVFIYYRLLKGYGPVRLELHPSFHFRRHEDPVDKFLDFPYEILLKADHFEIFNNSETPALKIKMFNRESAFTAHNGEISEIFYRREAERGYESKGKLWKPGYFRAYLHPGQDTVLAASTEKWETFLALTPNEALISEKERRQRLVDTSDENLQSGIPAELVLAADQFVMQPVGRTEDAARAKAAGDEVRSIIAGYHWFTDWGRDTMISLEGLTLVTGRFNEARWILKTFAYYIRNGLIPNMFPEGEKEGLYHTTDATLWFFHAVHKYLEYTNDVSTIKILLPSLKKIIQYHIKGTDFGIGVDENDGLIKQGKEGYQLTWMDAKVDDWVVTPRRGKAVEINALWYNALCLIQSWLNEYDSEDDSIETYSEYAKRARESFNKRFWYREKEYLFDVVDGENGDDSSFRPNQIFSISLPNPILDSNKWEIVFKKVEEQLLTPVGLRSLAPRHPEYKDKYFGNLRARDAAYHQGTVWGWLIGPFIDAYLKIYPKGGKKITKYLEGFTLHLNEACIGSISEIFDAEVPFTPRGCIAQAWSVAEVLRCYKLKI